MRLDLNTIKSCIYGGAIGDALGMSVECVAREAVRQMDFKEIESKINWFTDDTSLTLASMDAIVKSGFKLETFMENFADWFYEGKYTTLGYPYGYGKGTKNAIEKFVKTGNVKNCGGTSIDNNGNGALMRITPVCLALIEKNKNIDECVTILNNITGITHNHNISKMANVMYFAFLKGLLIRYDKLEGLRYMQELNYEKYFDKETISFYKDLLENKIIFEPEDKRNFGVIETLKSVIYCIMNNTNYEDSIKCAINLGYDTDTIAAITGNIAGILYGYETIPVNWLEDLQGKDIIDKMIKKFSKKLLKESD